MLHSSTDELEHTQNAVHDKNIFLVVNESTPSGIHDSNILVGSLQTPHISYTIDNLLFVPLCQIATAFLKQLTILIDLLKSRETLSVFYWQMPQSI